MGMIERGLPANPRYFRHSDCVTKTKRWRALRLVILRRDNWTCQDCGDYGNECDHILPVRTHPVLGFEESNLQCLCGGCHSLKTLVELGNAPLSPARKEWRRFTKTITEGLDQCCRV